MRNPISSLLLSAVLLSALVLVTGCSSSLKGDTYSRNEAQRAMTFEWATVESTRPVVIEGDRTEKGTLVGGVR